MCRDTPVEGGFDDDAVYYYFVLLCSYYERKPWFG